MIDGTDNDYNHNTGDQVNGGEEDGLLTKNRSGGLSVDENNSLNNSECFSKFDL